MAGVTYNQRGAVITVRRPSKIKVSTTWCHEIGKLLLLHLEMSCSLGAGRIPRSPNYAYLSLPPPRIYRSATTTTLRATLGRLRRG